jgi:glycosyltransferase involved in cell wall biosynthesis
VRPRFSVVIPVHDRAAVIGRAIASVLAQTFAGFEVVVVDDGSTDDSVAAARAVADDRVRIIRLDHEGEQAARAAGTRRAHGTWIVHLDADDELAPGMLARLGRLIDATGAAMVSCGGEQRNADGRSMPFAPVPVTGVIDTETPLCAADGRPVKACLRTGAFATTRERLHRVGAFRGPLDPRAEHPAGGGCRATGPSASGLSSTVHTAGTGCLDPDAHGDPVVDPRVFDPAPEAATAYTFEPDGLPLAELGRRVVLSVLEDGLEVVHTAEPLVTWNEPSPVGSPCADELRLHCARQAIDAIARTPIPDGDLLARYATIGGVAAARLRDRGEARRLFRIARRARPDVAKHWVRNVVAWVPPAADHLWEPTDAAVDERGPSPVALAR